jgi:aldehyde:ferredoxin oxidoreductase
MYGYMGRILIVDLSDQAVTIEKKEIPFYRKYLGGSFLAAKLFADHVIQNEQLTAFAEKSPIVFAPGPMAGDNLCGMTRVNILSLSPETPGIYTSQAGGEFGPEIKRAGYDALVIKGQAKNPTYLTIDNDHIEFCDAGEYWGQDRISTYYQLSGKYENRYTVATIGPAAENLVYHANIMFEPDHFAGRGGLGAVIGSKKLKAICIRGDQKVKFKNRQKLIEINRQGGKSFKEEFKVNSEGYLGTLRRHGTFGLLAPNQASGNIPVNKVVS